MGFDCLNPDHCHSKEGPLYVLTLVKEALGTYFVFSFIYKDFICMFFFILFQFSDI